MEKEELIINCKKKYQQSCRTAPFRIVVYNLNYLSNNQDKILIDSLIEKANILANKVNPGAANDSIHQRNNRRILANCIAGVVSEYFWKYYLNSDNIIVTETEFNDASQQIDLKVISNNKKIEVRSSFPRAGVEFAICHPIYQFDILGPYSNKYKPEEIQKDYYVRTLFHLNTPVDIITNIKMDKFPVYLTGGATWGMMINNKYSMNKDLIPESDFFRTEIATTYRVVPFSRAADTIQIKNAIVNNMDV